MRRCRCLLVLAITSLAAMTLPTAIAHASDEVTYVVESADFDAVDGIEYFDGARRVLIRNVMLPWRMTVPVAAPRSLGFDGAEVRADWRAAARPGKWVSAQVFVGPTLVCQNALDVGNVACYGSTNFQS